MDDESRTEPPTPEEIEAQTAEIRAGWTEAERISRVRGWPLSEKAIERGIEAERRARERLRARCTTSTTTPRV